jgi:hypothetical protein
VFFFFTFGKDFYWIFALFGVFYEIEVIEIKKIDPLFDHLKGVEFLSEFFRAFFEWCKNRNFFSKIKRPRKVI